VLEIALNDEAKTKVHAIKTLAVATMSLSPKGVAPATVIHIAEALHGLDELSPVAHGAHVVVDRRLPMKRMDIRERCARTATGRFKVQRTNKFTQEARKRY
jgi:hypothetical protein